MKNIQSTLEILLNEFEKDLNLKDSIFKKLNIKIDTPAYNFINSIKNHVSNSDLSKEYILSKFKISNILHSKAIAPYRNRGNAKVNMPFHCLCLFQYSLYLRTEVWANTRLR